jgi:class 3 adenylate cyclase
MLLPSLFLVEQLAETQGADKAMTILNFFYKTVHKVVTAHGGMVKTFLGNSFISTFGIQLNNAIEEGGRACHASISSALKIRKAMHNWIAAADSEVYPGLEKLIVRIGVSSGIG